MSSTDLKVSVDDIPAITALLPTALEGGRLKVALPAGGSGLTDTELRAAPVPVSAASLPLPAGAATEATLASVDGKLPVLVGGRIPVVLPAGGGLTDAELRASPVPVSAASLPLPAGAATEATLALIKTKTDNLDVALSTRAVTGLTDAQLRAVAVPVSGTFFQVTQPVSGTFWQATQPVSGTFFQATQPVSGTFWQVTQPVSGTFWQATQPVSGTFWPTTAAAPLSSRLSDGAAFYDAAKTGQLPTGLVGARLDCNNGSWMGSTAATVGQKAMASCIPVVLASDQASIPVVATAPTLTKGTQGATGYSVQNLKDAGRVLKTYTVSGLACVTAEALISLTPYADLTAAGAATTFAVTSGKRLRIQSIRVTGRCTSTVAVGIVVRFRMLAGTVLVTSPVHNSIGGNAGVTTLSVIGQSWSGQIDFPDGLELSGTMQFGLTQICSAVSATIDVHVVGYEY